MASTKSTRTRTSYVCTECGWTSPKWLGQCRECRAWGTLEEFIEGGPEAVGSAVCRVGRRSGGRQAEGLAHVLGTGHGVDFLTRLGEAGELSSLATLWVQGVEVAWPEVLPTRGARRVSLPTYPFASPVHSLAGTEPADQAPPTAVGGEQDRPDARDGLAPRTDRELDDASSAWTDPNPGSATTSSPVSLWCPA